MVVIQGIGLAKISLANARGGSALAARTVSHTLNNVPIDRYVRINIGAFEDWWIFWVVWRCLYLSGCLQGRYSTTGN